MGRSLNPTATRSWTLSDPQTVKSLRVTLADEEDTRRAIAAAKRAFATYGRSTREERAEILRRLHEAASACR